MQEYGVDKQTGTTAATKKCVDNGYLAWFTPWAKTQSELWKTQGKCMKPGATHTKTGKGAAGSDHHFPMQNVEKIRFKMSSEVVCPVRESNAHSAR